MAHESENKQTIVNTELTTVELVSTMDRINKSLIRSIQNLSDKDLLEALFEFFPLSKNGKIKFAKFLIGKERFSKKVDIQNEIHRVNG